MGYRISIHHMLETFQSAQQVITVFPENNTYGKQVVISYSGLEGIVKLYIEKYNLLQYI